MERILIIRSEKEPCSRRYALIIDEEFPVYFADIRVAADYLKERVDQGKVIS